MSVCYVIFVAWNREQNGLFIQQIFNEYSYVLNTFLHTRLFNKVGALMALNISGGEEIDHNFYKTKQKQCHIVLKPLQGFNNR